MKVTTVMSRPGIAVLPSTSLKDAAAEPLALTLPAGLEVRLARRGARC